MAVFEAVVANTWNPDLLYLSALAARGRLLDMGRDSEETVEVLNELMTAGFEAGNRNPYTRIWRT